ncbi:MAG TPA: cbb3-type cytochrome c oxidase subunit I [Verrucomicrobiae bacterium]|nr:cbb3-type cytochrome c oxidase subunit I [Verrucomicrobiae bacterium]
MNPSCSTTVALEPDPALRRIDASVSAPLIALFYGSAIWLVLGSIFGLLASIKFHGPNFLANCEWLTYGRLYPAATNALLYGFAIPAGLGVGLWIIARVGRISAVQPAVMVLGAKLWHLGVLIGLIQIFAGNTTGFQSLEMPKSAAVLLFLGYSLVAVWTLLTLHARTVRALTPAQWFLIAALYWFPWIFSTAHLLLTMFPVRGVTQSVVAWWFAANLHIVWLGLVGLAAIFHFIPTLMNRALHSDYLAYFTFWTIILFGGWCGIPSTAPLPAWMPALSTIATVLTLVTVLSVVVNVYRTCGRGCAQSENPAPGKFIAFGAMAFVVAWLMNVAVALTELTPFLHFTWFTFAQSHLNVFGFFSLTMIGAIYYIVPRATGVAWPCANRIRANYWLAAIGTVLYAGPLAIGGIVQGVKMSNPETGFGAVSRAYLMPLRISSIGEILILTANVLLLFNLTSVLVRFARQQLRPVETSSTSATVAEVKS